MCHHKFSGCCSLGASFPTRQSLKSRKTKDPTVANEKCHREDAEGSAVCSWSEFSWDVFATKNYPPLTTVSCSACLSANKFVMCLHESPGALQPSVMIAKCKHDYCFFLRVSQSILPSVFSCNLTNIVTARTTNSAHGKLFNIYIGEMWHQKCS